MCSKRQAQRGALLTEEPDHVVFLDHGTPLLSIGEIVKLLLVVVQFLLKVMLHVRRQTIPAVQSSFYCPRPFLEPVDARRFVSSGAPPLLELETLVARGTFARLASDRMPGVEFGVLPLRAHDSVEYDAPPCL